MLDVWLGVIAASLLIALVCVSVFFREYWTSEAQRRRGEREREEESQREDRRRRGELQEELLTRAKVREKELAEQYQLALGQAVQQMRSAAEQRFQSVLSANNLEELDEQLRQGQILFSQPGRAVMVRVVGSPTGRVGIEWMLMPDWPRELYIVLYKGSKIVRTECGFRGLYCDTLVRGKEYGFSIEAYDGSKNQEPNFYFVVKVPTKKQWERKVTPAKPPVQDDESQRQERFKQRIRRLQDQHDFGEQVRKEVHESIEASDLAEPEKRRKKAHFDATYAAEIEKLEE